MKFEHIETEVLEKDLLPEHEHLIEEIKNDLEPILAKLASGAEQQIGSGNSAKVYYHEKNPNVCFKILLRGQKGVVHSVDTELDYLSRAHNTDREVGTPLALMAMRADLKPEEQEDLKMNKINAMAMERIDGVTLEDIIQGRAEFSDYFKTVQDVRTYFAKMRRFVEKLNQEKGIYHKDLFDRNMMIGKDGKPWVIDFGAAAYEPLDSDRIHLWDQEALRLTQIQFEKWIAGKILTK